MLGPMGAHLTPQEAKRTVRVFALASFLHDLGADMIFSVWPLFLTNVLGANMQAVGFIDGLGDAVVSISQAASGYASDRIRKRKVFVWVGYLCGGVARVGYAFAPAWQWVLPFRILDRSGKMRGSPRDAIMADISTRHNRGGNFGLQRAMDNGGAVVGIVLSMLLIGHLGYRTIFLLAVIPSLLAMLLVMVFIRETLPSSAGIFPGVRLRDLTPQLRLYLLASALFALGNFSYSFLLLFATQAGWSAASVPALYLLFTVVTALFSIPFGRLADAWSRKLVLLVSLGCWAAVLALFALDRSPLTVIAAFVLYGLHKAAYDPVEKTIIAELAPAEYKASVLGGFQMVVGLCSLPASMIAGILWDQAGANAPFLFSLTMTLLAGCLLLWLKERK